MSECYQDMNLSWETREYMEYRVKKERHGLALLLAGV